MSFRLELELRGLEFRGQLRLRTSPYDNGEMSINFAQPPRITMSVSSHVQAGGVKLPVAIQRTIERKISDKMIEAMTQAVEEKMCGDQNWIPVAMAPDEFSTALQKWASVADYPFRFSKTPDASDGHSDEMEMMRFALNAAMEAEQQMEAKLQVIREKRQRMQNFLAKR